MHQTSREGKGYIVIRERFKLKSNRTKKKRKDKKRNKIIFFFPTVCNMMRDQKIQWSEKFRMSQDKKRTGSLNLVRCCMWRKRYWARVNQDLFFLPKYEWCAWSDLHVNIMQWMWGKWSICDVLRLNIWWNDRSCSLGDESDANKTEVI